jgi:hypothetical protein
MHLTTVCLARLPVLSRLPNQIRPATQYLTGWTRDFITVLSPA